MKRGGVRTSERGVSEIYGTALIISLVLISALFIVGTGTFVVTQLTQDTTDGLTQDAILEMGDRLNGITEDDIEDSTVFEFPAGSGDQMDAMADEGVANITIEVDQNYTELTEAERESLDDDLSDGTYSDGTFSLEIEMGTIIHEDDNGVVTGYQGGAVWERQPNGNVQARSMPPLAFEDGSIDLSFVSLDGINGISEGQELTAQQNVSVAGEDDIETAIEQMQDIDIEGVNAPLNITVEIESQHFAYGWAQYAENSLSDDPTVTREPTGDNFEEYDDEVTINFGWFGDGFGDSDFDDPVVYSGVADGAPIEHAPETGGGNNEIVHGDDPGEIILEEIGRNPPAASPQYWVMIYDTREDHWWYQGHGPAAESWVNVANGSKVDHIEEINSEFEFNLDEPDEATYNLEEDTPIIIFGDETSGPQQPDWDDRQDAEDLINNDGTQTMSGIDNEDSLKAQPETPDFNVSVDSIKVGGADFEGSYPSNPQILEPGGTVDIDITFEATEGEGGPGVEPTDVDFVLGAFDEDDDPKGFLDFEEEAFDETDAEDILKEDSNNPDFETFEFIAGQDMAWEVPARGDGAGLFVTAVWEDGLHTEPIDESAFEIIEADIPEFEFENADEFGVDSTYAVGDHIYPDSDDDPLEVVNTDTVHDGAATVTLLREDAAGENPIPVGQYTTDTVDPGETYEIDSSAVRNDLSWTGAEGEYQYNLTVGAAGTDDYEGVGQFEVEDLTDEVNIVDITTPSDGEVFSEGDSVDVGAAIEYEGDEETLVALTVDGQLVNGAVVEPADEEVVFENDSAWRIPLGFTGDDEEVNAEIAVEGANEERVGVTVEESEVESIEPDFNIEEVTLPDGEEVREGESFTVEANISNDGDEATAPVNLFVPEPEGTQSSDDSGSITAGGEGMQLEDITTENVGAGYEIVELEWENPIGLDPTEEYELNITTDGDYETKAFEVEPQIVIDDLETEQDNANTNNPPQTARASATVEATYTGEGETDAVIRLEKPNGELIEERTESVPPSGGSYDFNWNTRQSGPVTAFVEMDGEETDEQEDELSLVVGAPNCNTVEFDDPTDDDYDHGISTLDQLQCINDGGLDEDYELLNDIDATGTQYWNDGKGFEPIGPTGNRYTVHGSNDNPDNWETFGGHFDGGGHEVRDLFIERPDEVFVGLFGATNYPRGFDGSGNGPGEGSLIENIRLADVYVHGERHVGGLVGQAGGTVVDSRSEGTVKAEYQLVGGLIGDGAHADVDNRLVAEGTVIGGEFRTPTWEADEGDYYWNRGIGGLIGRSTWQTDVSTGYAIVDVEGPSMVGGIVGSSSNVESEFTQMYTAPELTIPPGGDDSYKGAVAGTIENSDDSFRESVYHDASHPYISQTYGDEYHTGTGWTDEALSRSTDEMQGLDVNEPGRLDNLLFDEDGGPWVAVPDDYPRFAWELAAEGIVEVEINEGDSDAEATETQSLDISATVTSEITASEPDEQTRTVVLFDPSGNPVDSTSVTLSELEVGDEPSYDNGAIKDIELEWQTLRGDATDGPEDIHVQVLEEGEDLDDEQFYVDSTLVEIEEIDDPESAFLVDDMVIEAAEPVEQGNDEIWVSADITHEWENIAVDGDNDDDTIEFESPVFLTIDDVPVAEADVSNEVGEPDGDAHLGQVTFEEVTVPTQLDIPEGETEDVDVSVTTPADSETEALAVEGIDDDIDFESFDIDIVDVTATGTPDSDDIITEDEGVFETDISIDDPVRLDLTVDNTQDVASTQTILVTDQDGNPLSVKGVALEAGGTDSVAMDNVVPDSSVEELLVETELSAESEDEAEVFIDELGEGGIGPEIESVAYEVAGEGEQERFDDPEEFAISVSDLAELEDITITADVAFEEELDTDMRAFLQASERGDDGQNAVVTSTEVSDGDDEVKFTWALDDRFPPALNEPLDLEAFTGLDSSKPEYAVEFDLPDDVPEFGLDGDDNPVDIGLDEIVIS